MLYPIELQALTLSGTAPAAGGEHGRITGRRAPRHLPVCADGSYKTRTCDLHDVNVAL
jgi:hypothetical protein